MKTIFSLLFAGLFATNLMAQVNTSPNPYPKTITVTGSASMDIIPDEIYVNVVLQEYQKKSESKKDIETIKSQFLDNCRQAGIPDSSISIVAFTGAGNYYIWRKRKRDNDLQSSITYQVKFKSSTLMDALVDKLDDEATQSFQVVRTSHSRMSEFRRQLKIKAVQAAKEKGIYLTDAIGEKLGEAITINEPQDPNTDLVSRRDNYNIPVSQSNVAFSEFDKSFSGKSTEIDFRRITLRYEVEIVFALK